MLEHGRGIEVTPVEASGDSVLEAFCHTCLIALYTAGELNLITRLVAYSAVYSHTLAYTEQHLVSVIYKNVEIFSSCELFDTSDTDPNYPEVKEAN